MICSSGVGFDPVCQGKTLHFGFHGIWQGTAVLYDRETSSHWLHLTGECIAGPLKGEQLRPIVGRHLPWREWQESHPNTGVMAENPRFRDKYFSRHAAARGNDYFPSTFAGTIQSNDQRYTRSELVYGIATPQEARAYPFRELNRRTTSVLNDMVGETPVVIVYRFGSKSAAGMKRVLDDKVLEFDEAAGSMLRDRQSGSTFNADGECVEGPLRGRRLESLGLQAEWYGWFATHPATSVWQAKP